MGGGAGGGVKGVGVLLGQGRERYWAAGDADALPLAEKASANHRAFRPPLRRRADDELDAAVVYEHSIAGSQCIDELGMADFDLVRGASRPSHEHHLAASRQAHER